MIDASVTVSTDMFKTPGRAEMHSNRARLTTPGVRHTHKLACKHMQDQGKAAPHISALLLCQSMQALLACPVPAWQKNFPPALHCCTAIEPGSDCLARSTPHTNYNLHANHTSTITPMQDEGVYAWKRPCTQAPCSAVNECGRCCCCAVQHQHPQDTRSKASPHPHAMKQQQLQSDKTKLSLFAHGFTPDISATPSMPGHVRRTV